MINVSNSFKEELNNDNRDYMCYVDIVLVNPGDVVESYLQDSSGEYILDSSGENINTFFDGVVISLTNENLWSSALSIEESVSNQNSFDIGSVIINKATIVINNIYEDYTSYDFTGAKVTIRIGLQLSNGTIEVVNKGIFYVDSATYNGSLITLECLDSMSKFDKDYSESELIYPATLRQIVQDACSVCGVLYSASIFENDTFIVNERPSDESLTFRQMLNYVGQIACQQFSIDHNDRLIARWYDRDMMDDLYSSPSSVDDSEYHQISSINSQNINQDDVIITGVKVTEFSESTENPGGSYLSGTTGYVIEIKDNKLIPIGKGSGVSTYLGQKLVGMRFRPMELTFQNDPTIEPTDIAEVIDFKGNHFYTFITSTNFTVGNTQTLSCGAESPIRNSASRYSAATQAYTNSKKLVEKEKTERELAVEALNNALSNASGMYTTEERQSDGSVITYLHDKPTLEESQNVIMITAEAIGISNDGGETYPYGLFLTGDLIARLLYVVGINADYINSGAITVADNDGEITFFADTETGRVDIKAYSLTITGKTVEEIANEESETVLNDFVGSVYTPTITNLQNQIDGQIETWFYNYIPTAENYPASEWTTDTEKDKHLGDLFYVVDNAEYGGQAYRWAKIGTDYLWDYVEDTAVVKALADAATAKDTADQKRRVFVTTPYPPYDVGDLWVGDDTSDMMRCQVSRQSGNYVSTDWIKAVKYTDDTELYNFVQNEYTQTIQEIYDSVDQKSETWYQSEDPSLNWTEKENVSLSDTSSDVILDVSGEEITTIFESEKSKHDGDLWKDSDTNVEYIYKDGVWIEMPIPDDVFDKIDGKAQIFVTQPVPPYSIGDLWFNSDTSDIMTCINSRDNGSYNEGDWQKRNKYTDDTYAEQVENNLNNFSEAVTEDMDNLQTQIDGKIETWYYEHEPTLENEPASGWTTDAEKQKHIGDLFYRQSNGHSYRFMKTGEDEFEWTLIQDSDIQNALTTANNAQDTADNKRRVFVVTPQPPYDIGDLWCNGEDILTCSTARPQGSIYVSSDWEKLNSYTDDTVANEALEEARQARNLNIILDNEYQGIPADYEGNIDTFPEVKTFVQVLYGHTDVSTDCIYAITKSNSVTGSWDNAARTYTVTGLSEDTGWVDITASYLSLFTTTKRFNVQKVKDGEPGEDGPPGATGAPGRTYTIEPSVNVLKRASDNSISPNFIEFNAYYRDGNSATRTAYAGRWIIEETADGDEWTTIYTSSANENSVTHYLYSMLADSDGSAIANANGDTIGIPRDIVAIRAKLYAAGGTTNLLDMQSVVVVIDVSGLTQEEIFNLLTNNGEAQGIYQEGNQLYINASFVKSGILSIGGNGNKYGELYVYSENEKRFLSVNKNGFLCTVPSYSGDLNFSIYPGEYGGYVRVYKNLDSRYTDLTDGSIGTYDVDESGKRTSRLNYNQLSFEKIEYDSDGNQTGYKYVNLSPELFQMSGTKSRIIQTEYFENVLQYCYEMPTPFFGDIGSGKLDKNGTSYIDIEEIFKSTINTENCTYYVFLQKEGEGEIWVEEKNQNYFVVKGTPGLNFSWEIKARQREYEELRLDKFEKPEEEKDIDYAAQGIETLTQYINNMEGTII